MAEPGRNVADLAIDEAGARALALLLPVLLCSLPAILVLILAIGAPVSQQLLTAAMVAWSVLAWVLHKRGQHDASMATLVFGLILIGAAFCAAYGSIRSIGTAISVAGVAGAGVFLNRRMLIAAAALSVVLTGMLVLAERYVVIGPPYDYQVGIVHWLAYVTIFACVGLGAHHSRTLLIAALERSRRSTERLAKVFDVVPVSLTVSRAGDGRLLASNAADEQQLNGASAEARQVFRAGVEATGGVATGEATVQGQSGEPLAVEYWATRIDFDGEPAVLTAAVNITARKREEDLIVATAAGVAGETGARLFRSLVERLAATLGCEIAICGEFIAQGSLHALAMIQDGQLMPHAQIDVSGTACGGLPMDGSLAFTARDIGATFPDALEALDDRIQGHVGMLLRDADGRPLGALSAYSYQPLLRTPRMEALFRIFAARAEAELRHLRREREIQRLNLRLESRFRERTADLESFGDAAAHDLRAPLSSISALSTLLKRDFGALLPPEALQHLDRIGGSAVQMGELLDALLEFSRLGVESMEPGPVDMTALARRAIEEVVGSAPTRVRFELRDLPPSFGEARLLALVWRNLLDNAVKFTRGAAEPLVRISAQVEGGGVRYSVSDNGAGFDARHVDTLFKVFERLHTAAEFEGNGIGLALVKRVVTRHGGTVDANGLPEGGATFAFTLPGERRQPERATWGRSAGVLRSPSSTS